MQPEIVMDPSTFESEVNQEDYQYFHLPVAHIEYKKGQQHILTHGDAEIESLLFPVLYPWGQDYWQAKPFYEHQLFQDTRLEDAKIKLSSFIPHYCADHYWLAWTYLEIETHRILQNSLRLIST